MFFKKFDKYKAQFLKLLDKKDKINYIKILFLSFLGSIFELLGLGILLPVLTILIKDDTQFLDNIPLINKLNLEDKTELLTFFFFLIIIVYLIKSLIIGYIKLQNAKFIFSINDKISSKVFRNYMNKNYLFHVNTNTADLTKNVLSETRSFSQGLLSSTLNIILDLIITFVILLFLFFLYPKITLLIFLMFSAAIIIYLKFFRKKMLNLGRERVKNEGLRFKDIFQGFYGIKEILVFNKKKFFIDYFSETNLKLNIVGTKHLFYSSIPQIFLELFTVFILCAFTITLLNIGYSTQELLIILGIYAASIFKLLPSASRIIASIQQISFSMPSLEILNKIFLDKETDLNQNIERDTENINFEKFIEIKNVLFRYEKNKKDLNLNVDSIIIKKNKVTGIVGESGTGKSTLISILLGLYGRENSQILVDNIPIVNFRSFRKIVGYVPQDIFLLNDTFKKNIAFGIEENNINLEKIKNSCKTANIQNFIEKTEFSYESLVGEKGLNISGGEKQRLGIARALYNNPKVLILDEATSSLDSLNEKSILDDLIKNNLSITIILISHKSNIIENYCDEIYKIENGKAKELKK
tara:strand:- start:2889 stop:4637 length:1749 start_codon:yes stop_codon:yes gene_type:complete